jgi:hypothetical protein
MVLKHQSPIYIVGLPRSGTTWLASILNTAWGVKYFYEPFNQQHVPEAKPHWMKYLTASDTDPAFAQFCRYIFTGQLKNPYVFRALSNPYKMFDGKLSWLPGRIMVKDVHSCMSLEWIDQHIAPKIVIIVRHPCSTVSSWIRTFNTKKNRRLDLLDKLLNQNKLMRDHLEPFENHLKQSEGLLQDSAAFWGAAYYVILRQKHLHPNWIFVQHEELCRNPRLEYQKLFDQLDLRWTKATDRLLDSSTSENSGKAYVPKRISSEEPDKWKKELESSQIDQIRDFVKPFEIPYYIDF